MLRNSLPSSMWIKPAIVVLLILLLISLFSGFVFLMKDQGTTKRTFYALGIRVTLALTLGAVVAWGFYTGELRSKAPWDAALEAKRQQQQQPAAPPKP
jgi:hypothetical protein